jgi:hypothetical protein
MCQRNSDSRGPLDDSTVGGSRDGRGCNSRRWFQCLMATGHTLSGVVNGDLLSLWPLGARATGAVAATL